MLFAEALPLVDSLNERAATWHSAFNATNIPHLLGLLLVALGLVSAQRRDSGPTIWTAAIVTILFLRQLLLYLFYFDGLTSPLGHPPLRDLRAFVIVVFVYLGAEIVRIWLKLFGEWRQALH